MPDNPRERVPGWSMYLWIQAAYPPFQKLRDGLFQWGYVIFLARSAVFLVQRDDDWDYHQGDLFHAHVPTHVGDEGVHRACNVSNLSVLLLAARLLVLRRGRCARRFCNNLVFR